ncbi:helix-turn-helix domain-containing protein [Streptomyces sp. NPDC054787]
MSSISDRVQSLMEQSGLNLRDFADHVDLDAAQLAESLSGTSPFSVVDIASIAEGCDVSVDWLLTGTEPPLAVAARTTTGEAGEALKAARDYTARRTDLDMLGYPQPWRPVTTAAHAGSSYTAQGQALAQAALKEIARQGRSVIVDNLAELIEETFGADIAIIELGDGFDGLTASTQDAKLIVLATTSNPARQRFTLAHELGHLLADDNQDVHLDRDIFATAQRRDPSEQRANAFAAVLLMPEDTLRGAFKTAGLTRESYAALAIDLMVSPEALAYRLEQLRLIDAGTRDQYKRMTASEAAGLIGRGEEFDRRAILAQQPRLPGLLARDTLAAYNAGKATLRPYATLLGVDVDDLRNELNPDQEDDGDA